LTALDWRLPDLEATTALGVQLARSLSWSERDTRVIFLRGELGAGKTTLAAATLQATGVPDVVRSPTFSLLELYDIAGGRRALHADLYRLMEPRDLEQLGLRDYLGGQTLLMVEWPERGEGVLPRPDLQISLLTVPGRQAMIEAGTDAGRQWLMRLASGHTRTDVPA
jgi:tRNA threonylcarbamoyladenosine biosynthesis protein TsaE